MTANFRTRSKGEVQKGLIGLLFSIMALASPAKGQDLDLGGGVQTPGAGATMNQVDLDSYINLWAAAYKAGPVLSGRFFVTPLGRSYTEVVPPAPEGLTAWQDRGGFVFGAKLYFESQASKKRTDRRSLLGLLAPEISRGDPGKFYVFLAGSGNMLSRALSKEASGGNWLVSQDDLGASAGVTQLGIGWQNGPVGLSLGYIDRNYKNEHLLKGMSVQHEGIAGLSLSFRPR